MMPLSLDAKAALLNLGLALREISAREGSIFLVFDEGLNLLHLSTPQGKDSAIPLDLLTQAARRAAKRLGRTWQSPCEEKLTIKSSTLRVVCHALREGSTFRGVLMVAQPALASLREERRDRTWRPSYGLEDIIGESAVIRRLKDQILRVSGSDSTVLIFGESGTGKELVAHALHAASQRRDRPFVRVECSSIPRELLESELFGHEPGAFTGASRVAKPGKFEMAQDGSILLDEIGDMPREMQGKLLRVLQEKELTRVGGLKPVKVDFRVIAATRRSLEEMVRADQFRDDLYYRLDVVQITAPPLRDHPEDLPALCEHILSRLAIRYRLPQIRVEPDTLRILESYPWPGNVRELMNILERVVVSCAPRAIAPDHVPDFLRSLGPVNESGPLSLRRAVCDVEARTIFEAIRLASGNKRKAAHLLKIHRSVLYRRMQALGIRAGVPASRPSKDRDK